MWVYRGVLWDTIRFQHLGFGDQSSGHLGVKVQGLMFRA